MAWVVGALVVLIAGITLRRLLRMDSRAARRLAGLLPLSQDRETLYLPIAREVATQCAILGISLNDAIEERDAGHDENAWRLVRLAASEWDRVDEIVGALMNAVGAHMPRARVVVPLRSITSHHFKSQTMIDYIRMHELLDQLVFRSKMRFQLQVRVLRRAAETLTTHFRRSYRYAERTGDRSPEVWQKIDLYFHDFDVVTKECLLAFRTFLFCLPHSALAPFATELEPVLRRAAVPGSVPADR